MISGVLAGVTWALETIVLGIALNMSPMVSTEQAIFLAPFVSTFLHDMFSALWATLYNLIRGKLKSVWHVITKTENGKFVVLGAVIGGPVGMTGYVLAVNYLGASIGAVASAIFPAIGSVLAYIFLKEKMQWYRWCFLAMTLLGVYGLSYSPELKVVNFWLGFLGAMMCAFGWGTEAVILAKCMKDENVKGEYALQIRQTTSAVINGLVILPIVKGWGFAVELFKNPSKNVIIVICIAGLLATVSYLFYYHAIAKVGASKAMALNSSYSAWAIVFTVVLLKDTSVFTFTTVICTVVVLVCSILAATDYKTIASEK